MNATLLPTMHIKFEKTKFQKIKYSKWTVVKPYTFGNAKVFFVQNKLIG